MPKIQDVGIGNYIRSPRNSKEVMQVHSNQGNSFLCFPVSDAKSVPVTLNTTRYLFINLDQVVDQVSI